MTGILLVVYAATVAPDVTLWDAGEFNAAIGSLGIPHPPGTPLYIVLANVWAKALGFLPQALAVNVLSAVATALACGLLGGLVTRWTSDRLMGVAGGLSAGTMLAVWQNATETEIYAVSMLLAVLMVVVGERAGRLDSARHRLLLAYLIGLTIPIQISALVAAPAAIMLAAQSPDARPAWRHLLSLGGVLLIVIALSQESVGVGVAGTVMLAASMAVGGQRGQTPLIANQGGLTPLLARLEGIALLVVAGVGISATVFMLVRAMHDPLINQGNPSSLGAMMDVVWRRQYPLPGLWPRQAPIWIQVLTFVQYADWQVASGLDASEAASWWRTPWSVAALVLGVVGARELGRRNRRGATSAAILFLMASLGIVAVLNLRAGPSILDSVLPPGATHEPRERDYFFSLAFATAGLWFGAGAVLVARKFLMPRPAMFAALAIAGLPLVLNWRAANRRPEGMLASALGESLLASSPRDAVLLLAGDNDSYTTWYRQSVLGERRDVVPVTISLLPARWYREELARRHDLFDSAGVNVWRGDEATLQALVAGARGKGRPVSAALTVRSTVRQQLAPAWTLGGMVFTADPGSPSRGDRVDTVATRTVIDLIAARRPGVSAGRDPAASYVLRILRCPSAALQLGSGSPGEPGTSLLDSWCNFK